jgi:hypothetical protein
MNSLLPAIRDWAGVVAIAISLAAFVLHFYEVRKNRRRHLNVRIGFGPIGDDEDHDIPGVWIEAANTGSVPVSVARWTGARFQVELVPRAKFRPARGFVATGTVRARVPEGLTLRQARYMDPDPRSRSD